MNIQEMKEKKKEMGYTNEQIAELKGDTNCAVCGKSIAKGMAYCPYCGEKVSTDVPTDADFVDQEEDIIVDVKETVDEVKEEATATQEKEEPEDKPQVQAEELKEEPEAQAEESLTESPEEQR